MRSISADMISTTGGGGCTGCGSGSVFAPVPDLRPRIGSLRALAPTPKMPAMDTRISKVFGTGLVVDRLKSLNLDILATKGGGGGNGGGIPGGESGGNGGGDTSGAKSPSMKKMIVGGVILAVVIVGGVVLARAALR